MSASCGIAVPWQAATDSPPQTAEFDKFLKGLNFDFSEKVTPFPLECQLPYRIVSDAMKFVDGAGDSPFLLQVSIPEPHNPEQVSTHGQKDDHGIHAQAETGAAGKPDAELECIECRQPLI